MLKQKTHKKALRNRKSKNAVRNSPGKAMKIKTTEAYDLVMEEIDVLMKKGEKNLSKVELNRLRMLTQAAENFEDENDPLPMPSNLPDIIKMKMFQLKLNQHSLASLLGISEAKLSLVLNGKQKPDVGLLKALHVKLKIDAVVLLEAV